MPPLVEAHHPAGHVPGEPLPGGRPQAAADFLRLGLGLPHGLQVTQAPQRREPAVGGGEESRPGGGLRAGPKGGGVRRLSCS